VLSRTMLREVLEAIPQVGQLRGLTYDSLARSIIAGIETKYVDELLTKVLEQIDKEIESGRHVVGKDVSAGWALIVHPEIRILLLRDSRSVYPGGAITHDGTLSGENLRVFGVPVFAQRTGLCAGDWRLENSQRVTLVGGHLAW
jgi:hypothetical protein